MVFDFDGTLADTEWPIYERAHSAVAVLGGDLTVELWATHAVGVSQGEPFWDGIAEGLGIDAAQSDFEEAFASVNHLPLLRDSAEVTVGAVDLIVELHDEGVPLAVASGSGQEWVEHHLGRFGVLDRFSRVVGRDHPEVTAGKPAPDLYLVAAAELGVDPRDVIAVEDSARGIASARAAGVGAVVAVPTRLTVHHDLSGADLVVTGLSELSVATLQAHR